MPCFSSTGWGSTPVSLSRHAVRSVSLSLSLVSYAPGPPRAPIWFESSSAAPEAPSSRTIRGQNRYQWDDVTFLCACALTRRVGTRASTRLRDSVARTIRSLTCSLVRATVACTSTRIHLAGKQRPRGWQPPTGNGRITTSSSSLPQAVGHDDGKMTHSKRLMFGFGLHVMVNGNAPT